MLAGFDGSATGAAIFFSFLSDVGGATGGGGAGVAGASCLAFLLFFGLGGGVSSDSESSLEEPLLLVPLEVPSESLDGEAGRGFLFFVGLVCS